MYKLRKTTSYVARISINTSLINFDKGMTKRVEEFNEKIIDYFKNVQLDKLIISPAYDWRYGDLEFGEEFIFGRLGKIVKGKTKFVYDETHKGFVEKESDEPEAELTTFLLSLKTHLLVFEERPSIGYKEFLFVFQESFNKFLKQDSAVTLELITNKQLIEAILDTAKKVLKAKFVLRPSNPDMDEDNKKIDEALKEMKADSAKLEVRSEDGLETKKPSLFRSSIAQGNKGYGHYAITYENQNGDILKFESRKKIFKENFEVSNNKDALKSKFKQILKNALSLLDKK